MSTETVLVKPRTRRSVLANKSKKQDMPATTTEPKVEELTSTISKLTIVQEQSKSEPSPSKVTDTEIGPNDRQTQTEDDRNKSEREFIDRSMEKIIRIQGILSEIQLERKFILPQEHDNHNTDLSTIVGLNAKNASALPALDSVSAIGSESTVTQFDYQDMIKREKEICTRLFEAVNDVPEWHELRGQLTTNLAVKIPIHLSTYTMLLQSCDDEIVTANFSIIEEVGNICHKLSPRIESALNVRNVNTGTEAMQQYVMDVFLLGILETFQEHFTKVNVCIDRNATENSATVRNARPDFLLSINRQLVFKGEEKKWGDVRVISEELNSKVRAGSIGGKNSPLKFLLGYATAGSDVLFQCIHSETLMSEVSDVLDMRKMFDRIRMIIIIVNMIRIVQAQILERSITCILEKLAL